MATFTSTTNGNLADGATYGNTSPGVRGTDFPGDDDVLVVASGDIVTMNADATIGSVDIQGTLTTDGTARTLTLDDGGQGYICENRGTVSTTINLTINSNYAGDRLIRLNNGGNGNFNNVSITLQASTRKLTIGTEAASIDGTLNITLGELNTDSSNDYALTVAGTTTIGDASHSSEDQATLTCNASAISLGSGKDDGWAIEMLAGGTFAGGIGTHTTGAIKQWVANTKFTFTSGTTTINSEYTSQDRMFSLTNGKSYNSDGRITLSGNFTSYIQWDTTAGDNGPHNLRINDANLTAKQRTDLTVEGYLKVDAGTFTTLYGASTSQDLTVTEYCDVTGTLTLNDSAVSVAALRCKSGAAVTQGSSGTLALATGSNFGGTEGASYSLRNIDGTSDINLGGTTTVTGGSYFEPRTATVYASVLNNIVWNSGQYWVGEILIGGTLVVNAAKHMQPYGGSKNVTVTGDVTLAGQLSAYPNGHTDLDTMTFGSLTINSGGAYAATTGTTTITGENSSGFAIQNAGTFTHNNGLVDIDFAIPTTTQASNGPYYDFTQSDAATDFYPAEAFEVMNNLSFVGDFEFQNNAHHLTVHGNMTIGNGTTTTRYMPYHTRTCNLTVGGILEVTNGATLTNFSHGTINVGGVRNTGGTM